MRRRSLGTLWLSQLLNIARSAQIVRLLLEVRVSNKEAIALYQKNDFLPIGVRKNYYKSKCGREDAVVMELLVNESQK
jgi:ribosomal-protein-alanine N-acetyltransferase